MVLLCSHCADIEEGNMTRQWVLPRTDFGSIPLVSPQVVPFLPKDNDTKFFDKMLIISWVSQHILVIPATQDTGKFEADPGKVSDPISDKIEKQKD